MTLQPMKKLFTLAIGLGWMVLFGLCIAQISRAAALVPFVLPWNDASPALFNKSSVAPAGEDGPVHAAADGHLSSGDHRVRFVGVNFAAHFAFLSHDQVDAVAARLEKFRINAVRM